MQTWQLILVILAAAMIAAVLLYLPLTIKRMESKITGSKAWISDDLGLVVYLCGKQGSGKTTLACGLVNDLQETLIDRAKMTIRNFATIYYDYDLIAANKIIDDFFNKSIWDSDLIAKQIMNDPAYKDLANTDYSNYLKLTPFKQLLINYVEAYLALKRSNYVYYANGKFYSFITNSWSMAYDPSMINIKDRLANNDYNVFRYSIIFADEQETNTNKADTHFKFLKEDGGSDLFLALIRHLGKGNIYYITTNQRFIGHNQKVERDLATSIIYVLHMRTINPYLFADIFFKFCRWAAKEMLSFKNDYIQRGELEQFYYKAWPKRFYFWANQKLKKHYSESYLTYKIVKYNSADDVGKRPENCMFECEKVDLTFPLAYCFGSVDRYQYACLQDLLVKSSRDYVAKATAQISDDDFSRALLEKSKRNKKDQDTTPKQHADK